MPEVYFNTLASTILALGAVGLFLAVAAFTYPESSRNVRRTAAISGLVCALALLGPYPLFLALGAS